MAADICSSFSRKIFSAVRTILAAAVLLLNYLLSCFCKPKWGKVFAAQALWLGVIFVSFHPQSAHAFNFCSLQNPAGDIGWDMVDNGIANIPFNIDAGDQSEIVGVTSVKVRGIHQYAGDLAAELISPSGTNVVLFALGNSAYGQTGTYNCSRADFDLTISDGSPGTDLSISTGANYCLTAGSRNRGSEGVWPQPYLPNFPAVTGLPVLRGSPRTYSSGGYTSNFLSNFVGDTATGDWTVRMVDAWAQDVGTLEEACVDLDFAAVTYDMWVSSNATCSDTLDTATFNYGDTVHICHVVSNEGSQNWNFQSASNNQSEALTPELTGAYTKAYGGTKTIRTAVRSYVAGVDALLPAGATTNFTGNVTIVGSDTFFTPADTLVTSEAVAITVNPKRPSIILTKISNGGTASFSFTGNNGYTAQTITTTSPGVGVAAVQRTFTAPAVSTTITEGAVAGYAMSGVTCTGVNGGTQPTVNLASRTIAFSPAQMTNGPDIACTVTNVRTPTVKVQKSTTGGFGGPFTFARTNLAAIGNITTTAAGTATPASPAAINVTTIGTAVTITETPAASYNLTGATCTDANSAVTGNTGSIGTVSGNVLTIPSVNVKAGADFTCLFTNSRLPALTITKVSNGGVGAFTFAGTNGLSSQVITTTTAGVGVAGTSQSFTATSTATTITETIPAGWAMTGVICTGTGGGTQPTVNLSTGQISFTAAQVATGANIACTVTNTRLPTITLRKISNGATGGFTFTGTNGWASQTITTTASGGAGTFGATQTLTAVATATTITETIPTGWTMAGVTCTGTGGGTQPTVNTAAGTIAFTTAQTAAGSNIACTITNTRAPTVKVQKSTTGGFGGPFTFARTNLAAIGNISTTASGTATPASPSALNVTTIGTAVTITETPAAGYALTGAVCTDANSAVTGNTGSIGTLASNVLTIPAGNVVVGADFTCVFTNVRRPTLTLTKISNGGVGPFTFTGNNGWSSQTVTPVSPGVGVAGATQTLTAASTATTITEAIPAGYVMVGATCTGTGGGTQPTVNTTAGTIAFTTAQTAAGSNITCTVTNRAVVDLVVTKTKAAGTYFPGSTVPFTITVTNNGPNQATNISLTDLLPSGLTYDTHSATQGSYISQPGSGVWTIGTLNSTTSATLSLDATVDAGTAGSTLTNTVTGVTLDQTDNNATPDDLSEPVTISTAPPPTGLPQCSGTNLLSNGGFENPVTASTTFQIVSPNIPSWTTTDSGIEIWDSGFNGVPSHTGGQFAELNAYIAGTLTNGSASVQPRAELNVYWAHRGRSGTDTGALSISDNGGSTTNTPNFSTGTSAWSEYGQTHVVSPTGTTTTLDFTAVSTGSGSISVGNFLDTVEICQTYITITKAFASKADVDSSSTDTVGDTITYTFTVSNPAGNNSGLSTVQIVDDKIGTFAAVPVSGDDGDNILEPGETWTVNGTYTLVQADLDAEEVVNIAYAQGDTGSNVIRSDDATETVTFTPAPSLTIVKSFSLTKGVGNTEPEAEAGDTIVYTYVVTNDGNQTISNVEVDDSGHTGQGPWVDPVHNVTITTDNGVSGNSPDSNGDTTIWGTLAPLDVVTFSSNYVVIQADIDGQM